MLTNGENWIWLPKALPGRQTIYKDETKPRKRNTQQPPTYTWVWKPKEKKTQATKATTHRWMPQAKRDTKAPQSQPKKEQAKVHQTFQWKPKRQHLNQHQSTSKWVPKVSKQGQANKDEPSVNQAEQSKRASQLQILSFVRSLFKQSSR